jgi:hypothetical protein
LGGIGQVFDCAQGDLERARDEFRALARSFRPRRTARSLLHEAAMRTLAVLCAAALLAACGASPYATDTFGDPQAGQRRSPNGNGQNPTGTFGGEGATPPASDCSEAAKLVYVVSAENDLYSFAPADLKFSPIGPLSCPASIGATPFSMAVDRSGTAYVNYTDGSIFRVSTKDASCQKTSFTPQQGFSTFGMGFASDAEGSSAETLYLCGYEFDQTGRTARGLGLAKLDVGTMALTRIADFSGALRGVGAELTGTGDAKLYGFFEGTPSRLAAIDKSGAQTPSPRSLNGVATGSSSAYAFSFWGGDFWFYTASLGDPGSKVTRYKAATDGSISVVVENTGMTIVGAGVSTCAPTKPVK